MKTNSITKYLTSLYENLSKDEKMLVRIVSIIFIVFMIYQFGTKVGKFSYYITH